MENATKALLIAAAVLVAVLIISLGIMVYTKASGAVEGAGNLSEYQIQQFNDKFIKYQGNNVSGSEVNALLTTVFNHNITQEDNSTCLWVEYTGNDPLTIIRQRTNLDTPAQVSSSGRYKVECFLNSNTKLVDRIVITRNS